MGVLGLMAHQRTIQLSLSQHIALKAVAAQISQLQSQSNAILVEAGLEPGRQFTIDANGLAVEFEE